MVAENKKTIRISYTTHKEISIDDFVNREEFSNEEELIHYIKQFPEDFVGFDYDDIHSVTIY